MDVTGHPLRLFDDVPIITKQDWQKRRVGFWVWWVGFWVWGHWWLLRARLLRGLQLRVAHQRRGLYLELASRSRGASGPPSVVDPILVAILPATERN
jgi:hypothetical protein